MKRLTVASAALAAGMLTIVAQSQAESDRNMFHRPVAKDATADRKTEKPVATTEKPVAKMEKPVAKDIAGKGAKRTASLAKAKTIKTGKAKAGKGKTGRFAVDLEKTASIARVRPELKAIARKSVKGFDSVATTKLDTVTLGESVASTAGYTTLVSRYATAYGVPVLLADAVISVESNYHPNTHGSAGEIGLMQIKPETARLMGYTGHASGLFNPETNIKYGMKYLGMAHQLSGGVTCGTILRYNAGHGARRMNPVSAAYCSKVKRRLGGA